MKQCYQMCLYISLMTSMSLIDAAEGPKKIEVKKIEENLAKNRLDNKYETVEKQFKEAQQERDENTKADKLFALQKEMEFLVPELERVKKQVPEYLREDFKNLRNDISTSLVTHLNETGGSIENINEIKKEAKGQVDNLIKDLQVDLAKSLEIPERGFFSDLGKQLQRVWLETKLAWQEAFGSGKKAAQTALDLANIYSDIDLRTQARLAGTKAEELARKFQNEAVKAAERLKKALAEYKKLPPEEQKAARANIAKYVVGAYQVDLDVSIAQIERNRNAIDLFIETELKPLLTDLKSLDLSAKYRLDLIDTLDLVEAVNFRMEDVENKPLADEYIKKQLKAKLRQALIEEQKQKK